MVLGATEGGGVANTGAKKDGPNRLNGCDARDRGPPGPVTPSPARKRQPGRHVAKQGPRLGHVAPVERRDRVRDEGTYTLTLRVRSRPLRSALPADTVMSVAIHTGEARPETAIYTIHHRFESSP